MFGEDFYPTPSHVIDIMLHGECLSGKRVLEPSAGKGNIVDRCRELGAEVTACEKHPELAAILANKCRVLAGDFLTVESDRVSHVDYIIMNPPFSADEKHVLHAWAIAPPGCKIIALCNANTVNGRVGRLYRSLSNKIESHGSFQELGDCFSEAERKTGVGIGLITLIKPGGGYGQEFEGFFMDEEPEETQGNGIMPYNFIRDVVNRYVAAVKVYDRQLESAVEMNGLLEGFYSSKLAFHCTEENRPKTRNEFKKDLQKNAWSFILKKMKMDKYTTRGLRDDLNRFVEQQQQVPFTMRNIYVMLETIIGTQSGRMDRAIMDVFGRLTQHYHENRFAVEGWKTNSHYLMNKKFILPYGVDTWDWNLKENKFRAGSSDIIDDLVKALCYLKGENYDGCTPLHGFTHRNECVFGRWYSWSFFEIKGFKKGTIHFKFQNGGDWELLNRNIARIMGYPLPENIKKAA